MGQENTDIAWATSDRLPTQTTHNTSGKGVLYGWRPQKFGAIGQVSRANGAVLYDPSNRPVLDFASGQVNVNIGHSHPRVIAAMQAQLDELCYVAPCLNTETRRHLSAAIDEVVPFKEPTTSFLCNSGSEAVESALKIAWSLTGRRKIYASSFSYHGATIGASSISGDARRRFAEPGLTGTRIFTAPFGDHEAFADLSMDERASRCLSLLKEQILRDGPDTVAAVILEPVIGSGGVYKWPTGFLTGLRAFCDDHGILLIFDETMSGWGRTGRWFASEHSGVLPDIMTTAKGITSGYVPLAAVVLPQRLAAIFDARPLVCGSTTEGHALGCAAALACIATYHEDGIVARAQATGSVLEGHLARIKAKHPCVKDARNVGLLACIELHASCARLSDEQAAMTPDISWAEAMYRVLWQNGVFTIVRDNMIMVTPPLIITEEELLQGLDAIETELVKFNLSADQTVE